MTINVALVTSDALILGCDSVASTSRVMLDPWQLVERNDDGTPKADHDGNFVARFRFEHFRSVVTDVWGGVTKMFELCRAGSKVAATTAGLASLGGRTMQNLAVQFARDLDANGGAADVGDVAQQFLAFIRGEFDKEYADPAIPNELKDQIEFLVGGYGVAGYFPSLYRLRVRENHIEKVWGEGEFGLAWAGQADGVSRLVFGYDLLLKYRAQRVTVAVVDDLYKQFSEASAKILQEVLAKLGAQLPQGVNTDLPEKPKVEFPWEDFQLDIECQNLPLQDAVDLVSYFVNVQAGRAKFVRGVATVGGRTRIGVFNQT